MIILVRHGESVANAARVLQHDDVPLNARGQKQAAQLAARLSALGVEHVLCSPARRARMTVEPLLRSTGAACDSLPELQERNFGELRGRSFGELGTGVFAPDFVPPGGESWETFHTRVDAAWAHVIALRSRLRGNLVVITHGLVCASLATRQRLALAHDQQVPARFRNASVTVCTATPPHRIELLNCAAHLDPDEDDPNAPLA